MHSGVRFGFLMIVLTALMSCSSSEQTIMSAMPSDAGTVRRGRELVRGLAACGSCHGETASPNSLLSGGRVMSDTYGTVRAANLTPDRTGLGTWRDYDVMIAIRAAVNPHGEWLSRDLHSGYEWMSDSDAFAIVSYLRTLPPIANDIERRNLSFVDRNTTGLLDARYVVKGYVPEIDSKAQVQYGQYLADNVARCGACHNSKSTMFENEQYLMGGRTISNEFGDKVAPGITSSLVFGIGEWSEDQIVEYLKTGIGPDAHSSDWHFCPWNYYSNASDSDLHAIASFLKTVAG